MIYMACWMVCTGGCGMRRGIEMMRFGTAERVYGEWAVYGMVCYVIYRAVQMAMRQEVQVAVRGGQVTVAEEAALEPTGLKEKGDRHGGAAKEGGIDEAGRCRSGS